MKGKNMYFESPKYKFIVRSKDFSFYKIIEANSYKHALEKAMLDTNLKEEDFKIELYTLKFLDDVIKGYDYTDLTSNRFIIPVNTINGIKGKFNLIDMFVLECSKLILGGDENLEEDVYLIKLKANEYRGLHNNINSFLDYTEREDDFNKLVTTLD